MSTNVQSVSTSAAACAAPVFDQLAELQQIIVGLEAELRMLRQRDETLRYYMQRVDEEMRLAARLQQDFLPKVLPQVGRVHFHTLFRPAGYVSGDLYDVMRLDETHVGVFLCDAVGHGMPAALLTMFIKRALITKEIYAGGKGYRLLEASETMRYLNDALVEQNLSQATYATAIYGIVNTQTLELRLSRGGHPAPALLRADGTLEFPKGDGALLGIFPDEPFVETRVQLRPGDRLFVYSDGVEVAFCGDDGMHIDRWRDCLRELRHLPAERMLGEFSEELDRQAGSLTPKDDITVVMMEIR
jgi:sigma-B regulation protein RsbU (phosphoserine phosphatase)